MSITSGPINESEQAGEKLVDHALDHFDRNLAPLVSVILDLLEGRKIVVSMALEKK
jgi:hypothetical protein